MGESLVCLYVGLHLSESDLLIHERMKLCIIIDVDIILLYCVVMYICT